MAKTPGAEDIAASQMLSNRGQLPLNLSVEDFVSRCIDHPLPTTIAQSLSDHLGVYQSGDLCLQQQAGDRSRKAFLGLWRGSSQIGWILLGRWPSEETKSGLLRVSRLMLKPMCPLSHTADSRHRFLRPSWNVRTISQVSSSSGKETS